jgi:predicted TIM-barrel fold metal-dependent hydrolase
MLTRREVLKGVGAVAASGFASLGAPTLAQAPSYQGPLIDAHSHANGENKYSQEQLAQVLTAAGVSKVVVFGAHPGFDPQSPIIPVASAQRMPRPSPSAAPDPDRLAELARGLKSRRLLGIKVAARHAPFPMMPGGLSGRADSPFIRALASVAADTGRVLTVHVEGSNVDDLAELLAAYPAATINMAHIGQRMTRYGVTGSPVSFSTVSSLLASYPNFVTDLSANVPERFGELSLSQWGPLIVAHADRFLFGLDMFLDYFPGTVAHDVRFWRSWLGGLPPEVAEQVAYRNAERIYLS